MPQLQVHDRVTGIRYLRDRAKQQSIAIEVPKLRKPLFAA
jgi:hypothetical protein